jgi:hypothetical protein
LILLEAIHGQKLLLELQLPLNVRMPFFRSAGSQSLQWEDLILETIRGCSKSLNVQKKVCFPFVHMSSIRLENMTKDVIQRAISRGENRALTENLHTATYEIRFPGGISMIVYTSLLVLLSFVVRQSPITKLVQQPVSSPLYLRYVERFLASLTSFPKRG